MKWVSSHARKKLKGFSSVDQRLNDIIFDFSPTDNTFKEELVKYLTILKGYSMKDFRGTGEEMITPFNTAGEVDYGVLSSLVESYIQSGIDFLVVLGTTAETVTLSQEEQIKVTRKGPKLMPEDFP